MRRRRGFTLLEMIVATAVMSIAVVGLLSLLTSILSNASRIKQYDQAAMRARSKMNDLLVLEPLPLGQPLSGQWAPSAGWSALAEVFERPPGSYPGALQLARIHLDVWWVERDQRRSIQLDSYRRVMIPIEARR